MSSGNPGSPAQPGEIFPNTIYLNRVMSEHQYRIRAAYNGDAFWDNFDTAPTHPCRWSGCQKNKAESHGHLHRGIDGGICPWDICTRLDDHIHKYKPPMDGRSGGARQMTPFDRVKLVVEDVLEPHHLNDALLNNIFELCEEEKAKHDADKDAKAKRIADAEKAGEEAARKYVEAEAARKAAKAEEMRKTGEAREAKRRRIAGRAAMTQELVSHNELERHVTEMETTPTLTQEMRDAQLEVYHQPRVRSQLVEDDSSSTDVDSRIPTTAAWGKRKRAEVSVPSSPSLSEADIADPDDLFEPEVACSPKGKVGDTVTPELPEMTDEEFGGSAQSQSSTLTAYTRDELDAILEGAEVIEEPRSSSAAHITSSSDPAGTTPAFADEPVRHNYGWTTMPPPPPPKLTPAQRAEREVNRETIARAQQIAAVLEDDTILQRKKRRWIFDIYEDP